VPANTPAVLHLSCAEPLDGVTTITAEIGGKAVSNVKVTEDKLIRIEAPAIGENTQLTVTIKNAEDAEAKALTVTLEPKTTCYYTQVDGGKTWPALTGPDLPQERLSGLPVAPLPAGWEPNAGAVGLLGMGGVGALPMAARAAAGSDLHSLAVHEVLDRVNEAE